MYVINGKFLGRKLTGQTRVAIELIKELDKIVSTNEIMIVAPKSPYNISKLEKISIVRIGKGNLHIWEQTVLFMYAIIKKATLINFTNSHPLFKPDIVYIHDTLFKAFPNIYSKTRYGYLSERYNLLMVKTSALWAKKIITVSQFSKKEIVKYYDVDDMRISVIYNAWQHMGKIDYDDNVFERHPEIKRKEYYLSISGITPQKNFSWIINNAQMYSVYNYVVAGKIERTTDIEIEKLDNIVYIGEVTDGEMKSLMKECLAFIHPALYEGFAMTPLEAMASGCSKLFISNTACLPEIYKDSVQYIDPHNCSIDLFEMLEERKDECSKIMELYSWKQSAQQLKYILANYKVIPIKKR